MLTGSGKYNAPLTINGTGANGLGALQINKDPNAVQLGGWSNSWNGTITLGSDSTIIRLYGGAVRSVRHNRRHHEW